MGIGKLVYNEGNMGHFTRVVYNTDKDLFRDITMILGCPYYRIQFDTGHY